MLKLKKVHFARRRKLSGRSMVGDIIILLFLAVMGVFMALPLVYAVVTAFKPV